MRLFLVFIIAALPLSACGQPDVAGLVATPLPTIAPSPTAALVPTPTSGTSVPLPPAATVATPLAGTDAPLPTWTPAPPGSLPPTPFPTPSPAPFPGDFVLTLAASPPQGTAPLQVTLSATLAGGPDNSYELYCTGTIWEFADGQDIMTSGSCPPWSPDARTPRAFTIEHIYEHAGTYLARLKIGRLESKIVIITVE